MINEDAAGAKQTDADGKVNFPAAATPCDVHVFMVGDSPAIYSFMGNSVSTLVMDHLGTKPASMYDLECYATLYPDITPLDSSSLVITAINTEPHGLGGLTTCLPPLLASPGVNCRLGDTYRMCSWQGGLFGDTPTAASFSEGLVSAHALTVTAVQTSNVSLGAWKLQSTAADAFDMYAYALYSGADLASLYRVNFTSVSGTAGLMKVQTVLPPGASEYRARSIGYRNQGTSEWAAWNMAEAASLASTINVTIPGLTAWSKLPTSTDRSFSVKGVPGLKGDLWRLQLMNAGHLWLVYFCNVSTGVGPSGTLPTSFPAAVSASHAIPMGVTLGCEAECVDIHGAVDYSSTATWMPTTPDDSEAGSIVSVIGTW